jgi:hypothetical protein
MKQVISNPNPQTYVSLKEVNSNLFYGVVAHGTKGFITRERYQAGDYFAACFNGVNCGSRWDAFHGTFTQVFDGLLTNGNFKIYEFNTWQELLTWALLPE